MTLETFNVLLAAGGGVVVPAGVGLFAAYKVYGREQFLSWFKPRPEAPREDITAAQPDHERVAA